MSSQQKQVKQLIQNHCTHRMKPRIQWLRVFRVILSTRWTQVSYNSKTFNRTRCRVIQVNHLVSINHSCLEHHRSNQILAYSNSTSKMGLRSMRMLVLLLSLDSLRKVKALLHSSSRHSRYSMPKEPCR